MILIISKMSFGPAASCGSGGLTMNPVIAALSSLSRPSKLAGEDVGGVCVCAWAEKAASTALAAGAGEDAPVSHPAAPPGPNQGRRGFPLLARCFGGPGGERCRGGRTGHEQATEHDQGPGAELDQPLYSLWQGHPLPLPCCESGILSNITLLPLPTSGSAA